MARNNLIVKETQHETIKRHKVTPHNADLILADISGSMMNPALEEKTRWECLQLALNPLKGRAHVLAFHSLVVECDPDNLPRPQGFTDLAKALALANSLEPLHVLVMCDGQPDSKEEAFSEAAKLAEQCIIDTIYIGPPLDSAAINFMRKLASVGHGRFSMFDLSQVKNETLAIGVESMLALPAPDSTIKL